MQGKLDPQGNLDAHGILLGEDLWNRFKGIFSRAILVTFEGLLAYQSSRCRLWDIDFV